MSAGRCDQLPASSLPEIVFSGKSNVGKSSLINRLINRKRLARVSSSPGKTATINFYNLSFCRFVDLPGYGYAKVSWSEKQRWSGLVEGYFQAGRDIRLLIQLVDIRRDPGEDDLQMLRFATERRIPCLIVATKSDKLSRGEREARLKSLENYLNEFKMALIPFSALSSEGTDKIKEQITMLLP